MSTQGLATAERLGVAPTAGDRPAAQRGRRDVDDGRLGPALQWLDEMLTQPLPAALAPPCRLEAARIQVARGDFAAAAALLDGIGADDLAAHPETAARWHAVAAESAVWQARPAEALTAAERAVGPAGGLVGLSDRLAGRRRGTCRG